MCYGNGRCPRSVLAQDPSSDRLVLRIVCNRDELLSRPPAFATDAVGGWPSDVR
jgi:hypothetical protein